MDSSSTVVCIQKIGGVKITVLIEEGKKINLKNLVFPGNFWYLFCIKKDDVNKKLNNTSKN